jgi:hypothetical protein
MLLASFMLCVGVLPFRSSYGSRCKTLQVNKASAGSKVFGAMALLLSSDKKQKKGFRHHIKGKGDYERTDRDTTIIRTKRRKNIFGCVLLEIQSKKENN